VKGLGPVSGDRPPRSRPTVGNRATVTELQDQLKTIVLEHGHLLCDPPIRLRSGELSRHFLDGKKALAQGFHLELACRALLELVNEGGIAFDAVGGLTLGADQFVYGTAIVADKEACVVRKEPKGRGTNKLIEGAELDPAVRGKVIRVLLVDDVVTTGGSIQQAYQAIEAEGGKVVAAVTLVDRADLAKTFFIERAVPYFPLLTYRDLDIPAVGDEHLGDAEAVS
jgi:orotate phosphoribosyltransferase